MRAKELIDTVQGLLTIGAIIVGGVWTYFLFVKERREFPHANIEQRIAHVPLSESTTILRVSADVTNTGAARLHSGKSIVRVQQVLPLPSCPAAGPCAVKEIEAALRVPERDADVFTWPLLAERVHDSSDTLDVEPGESETVEYEFALRRNITAVRVYSYFRNDERSAGSSEVGWSASTLYNLDARGTK
jgi:hypothetical protein